MAEKVIEYGYEAIISDAAKSIIGGGSDVPAYTGTYTYTLTENGATTTIEIKDMKATSNISITVDVPTPTVTNDEPGQE